MGGPPASAAAAAPGGAPLATIDPIKLIRRHKWILVASVVLGGLLGTVAHFVWAFTSPVYKASVLFDCYPPTSDIGQLAIMSPGSEQELERFMQTQVRFMTSELVLRRVIEDPQLEREAPKWCRQYYTDGKLNVSLAVKNLGEDLSARIVPRTKLIELSMGFWDKNDVAAVVRLVKQSYATILAQTSNRTAAEQRDSLARAITGADDEIVKLTDRRNRMVQESQVDTVDQRTTEARANLQLINEQLVNVNLDLEALKVRVKRSEEDLASPGGVRYPDQLRDDVERDQQMLQLRSQIANAESNMQVVSRRFKPDHREYRSAQSELESIRQTIDTTREQLLRTRFDAELDISRSGIARSEAQRADLLSKAQEIATRLTDLTRISGQIEDVTQNIQRLIESRNDLSNKLKNLDAISRLATSDRVIVYQDERVPDRISFPQLKILLPAGLVLVPLFTGGLLVLMELLDQRIKGPSDVALIPRTRVMGMVPDASEDPAGSGAVETAFRDRPRGVVAESYRQLRSGVLKRMQQSGHKSLLVVAGLPGSGATSVATNLAMTLAASDQRVLLIDANFRRPSLHRVLALPESPGLSDVLGGKSTFVDAIRPTGTQGLSLLSVGGRDFRQFERLSTDAMSRVLADAKAEFDWVIIDVAPAVVAGDAMALSNRVDASLLVVRALSEKRGMVARVKNELSETRADFLGVVVNVVKASAGGYLRGNMKATHDYHTEPGAKG
jgi:capsular exopolysaccharide synthesis family protein